MKYIRLATLASLLIYTSGCGETPPANTVANMPKANSTITPTATPADELAMGRQLYKTNCAACHREDGTGGKITIEGKSIKPDDLTSDKIKKFSDDKIIGYIYDGVEDEGMPAFKDKLSEAQIREVVRFVRTNIQEIPEKAGK